MDHLLASGRAVNEAEAQAAWNVIESIGAADTASGIESVQTIRAKERRAQRGEDGKVSVIEGIPGAPSSYQPLDYSPESLANLDAQMQAMGISSAVIRGSNRALPDDAGRLVRYYETNAGADVTTILHERVETLWKAGGIDSGEWFMAANELAAVLTPQAARTDGEKKVAESLLRIASDDPAVTPAERRETLVELIVADYLGRFSDGQEIMPGSVQAGVAAAAMTGSGPKRRAMESLKRMMAVVKRYLGAMFGVAKRIREARASGEIKPGEAWDTFANKMLGLDAQVSHEAAVATALNESADSFSLGPQRIEAAPAVVRIPEIEIPRNNRGMVAGLRAWLASAEAGLSERLQKLAGRTIINWGKLATFKPEENPLHHFQALAVLPEIYQESVIAFREADTEADSGVIYERRYGWAEFPDGKTRHVMLTARRYPDPSMPPGVYSLEALGLEIHETPLTYSSAPVRGTGDDIDQGAAAGRLAQFLRGINPEHRSGEQGETMSLGSVNTLEAIANRLEERIAAGGAAVKLEAYTDLSRRLEGMARAARGNEETEAILRAGEIEQQRKQLQQRLEAENMLALYSGPLGEALTSEESAAIKDDPLLSQLVRERDLSGKKLKGLQGRFKARSRATGGEYDDARNLPGWLFRGDVSPDEMAAELGFEYVPEMWAAIESALNSNARLRSRQESAREQEAEARARARNDARAWAAKERAKLASSDARDAKRALVTLDTIIAELPAEVRKKVGGFTAITELKTDDARRKHFLTMIDRIDVVFEDWLRADMVKSIQKEFKAAAAMRKPGERDKGKLGVNAHTWLETADNIMRLSPIRLEERGALVEKYLAGAEAMPPEVIDDFNRAWDFGTGENAARLALEQESALLEVFGGIAHRVDGRYERTSSEMEAALAAVRETIQRGRDEFGEVLRQRRDRRSGRRAGVMIDSGNSGLYSERKSAAMRAEGLGGQFSDYLRKGMNFEQFVGDVFGRESDTHKWAETTAMEARLSSEGLWQDAQSKLAGFLQSLWPRTSKVGIMRNLEDLQKSKPVPGAGNGFPELSEMEAVHFTMLWSDPESREWLTSHGFGAEAQDALESMISPAARSVRAFLVENYDAQYDALNDVYRRLHGVNMPRIRNYAPRAVLSGREAAVSNPLEGGQVTARGVFSGFTKRRRPDVKASPQVTDALVAFVQNQRVVSHFIGWAEASNELRAVFSNSETAPFIEAAAGAKGVVALNEWLSDLEQNGVREAIELASLNRWLRANADNALVGKLGVLAKQASAVYGSATEIGWGEYARSAGRLARGEAAITVEQAAELPVMKQRGFNRESIVGQASAGSGPKRYARALRRAGVPVEGVDLTLDYLRERIGGMDAWFTARSAAIAYDAKFREAQVLKMGTAEAKAYAEREMTRVIFRTAQPDNVAAKSKFENRAPASLRLLFAFQSMNRQMLFSTVAAFRDGGIKDVRAWRMALTHWALTGFITQVIGSAVRDWMSDDDEDKDWKAADFARAMLMGPLTGALHIGPVIEGAAAALGWGYEQRQAPGLASSTGTIVRVLSKALDDDKHGLTASQAEQAARATGMAGQAAFGGFWSGLNVFLNVGKQ